MDGRKNEEYSYEGDEDEEADFKCESGVINNTSSPPWLWSELSCVVEQLHTATHKHTRVEILQLKLANFTGELYKNELVHLQYWLERGCETSSELKLARAAATAIGKLQRRMRA